MLELPGGISGGSVGGYVWCRLASGEIFSATGERGRIVVVVGVLGAGLAGDVGRCSPSSS